MLADRAAFYLTIIAIDAGVVTFFAWLVAGAALDFIVTWVLTVPVIACPHALGLGVPANTGYRALAMSQPEAELMGLFGIIALAVNVAAALALISRRTGDANVRAVWLFSRNDVIGNFAVLLAALSVFSTSNAWRI